MAATPQPAPTMRKPVKIIALDLDGTLLNSDKKLTQGNLEALERAAAAGIHIVPTTGRFYGGMPDFIRELPFIRYVITINGAQVADLQTGQVIYRAELPAGQTVELMEYLDTLPVIYDCYMNNDAFMTEALKERVDEMVSSPHYRKMVRQLRKPVPELKQFILQQGSDVQKVQFFTNRPQLRLDLMEQLPRQFDNIIVSSSVVDNVEINQSHANKGEALLALAAHLGVAREETMSFGDGLNDLSMIRDAGVGVAMANACPEVKELADEITLSCDEDGVAHGINTLCF